MFIKLFGKNNNTKKFLTYDEKYLLEEIEQAKNELDIAYSNFQNATDPDMIDCCIYRVNAIQIRYKFLLARAKESNICGYITE